MRLLPLVCLLACLPPVWAADNPGKGKAAAFVAPATKLPPSVKRLGEPGTGWLLLGIGFELIRDRSLAGVRSAAVPFTLAVLWGVAGLVLASFLQAFTITTMNWQSFSQLAFGFHLTPSIAVATLAFSLVMGLVGGFLPSVRAARLERAVPFANAVLRRLSLGLDDLQGIDRGS